MSWIEPRPDALVLHVVDRGTHFSAVMFLEGESPEDVWNAFVSCWVTVYVAFPNILSHDYGPCFTSTFFKKTFEEFGIITKEIPCESHNSLGPGEHYHAPLRKIYKKIKVKQANRGNKLSLAIAFHGLNKTANPEGLIPSLLVSEEYLKLLSETFPTYL